MKYAKYCNAMQRHALNTLKNNTVRLTDARARAVRRHSTQALNAGTIVQYDLLRTNDLMDSV